MTEQITIEQVRIYIRAVDSGRIEKRALDGMQGLARLAIAQDEQIQALHGQLQRDREARPILPGERCLHKHGGAYLVIMRRLVYASLLEGEQLVSGPHTALVTDRTEIGEQIVIYRRDSDSECFARPSRLFDEPGRFTGFAAPHAEAGEEA